MLDADQQLAVIEGLRSGQAGAWAALYDGFSEDVWRYAARLLGNERDAVADVVQETFMAAARSARSFDPLRGSLRSWLLGIVHLQVAQHWRRRGRDARREERGARREDGRDHGVADPATPLVQRETAEHVRRILADMPTDYAWLLVAKYVEERPIAGIVDELAAGAEAVRSKLARARRMFRTAMSRERLGAGAESKP